MSNQTTNSSEEIDLFYLFSLVGNFFKKCFIAAYRFIIFLLKNWIILLALIFVGVLAGYFLQKDVENPKEANALIRINFDTGNYVYNAIDLLNEKIENRDSLFLKESGLWNQKSLLKRVKIKPVVNFNDLTEIYGTDNRTLGLLIESYEFEGENNLSESFNKDYLYHNLEIDLSSNATHEAIDNVINYINDNKLLRSLKKEAVAIIINKIDTNKETISQINAILNAYGAQQVSGVSSNQVILDKDLTGVIEKKNQLLLTNEELRENLVLSNDITVLVNKSNLIEKSHGILGNKMIVYPILLIFLFLLFALLKRAFIYARKLAQKEDAEKQTI
tara:strand:+ start:4699 stop:5694 length:996 start_codon:yes stop_codon:yes gene_type:complete